MKKEKYSFKSESKELLNLMIHSLYSNKEIFIRELISNASDAIEKDRFINVSQNNSNDLKKNYEIKINLDEKENKIKIKDNGIGMDKNEIIKNLGTIAKSGTKSFIKSIKNNKNNNLIGKFGVGFYSSFIVSKKVYVKTKSVKNKDKNTGIIWKSKGNGEYTVEKIKKKNTGTEIILFLKNSEKYFTNYYNIERIIKKYSDHINIPIKIKRYNEKNKKNVWKQINSAKSIWTIDKKNIDKYEYISFYKYITNDTNNPITWIHSKVEGNQEYISLLYIPSKAPWDIWNREQNKGLKLYINKVYIMDNVEQFLPNYLRFVKGIVDSKDLPLNISREILQENKNINIIKKTITKKILNVLKNINTYKYEIFWKEFGAIIKEGIAEDIENKENIAKLLLFSSLKTKNKNTYISLKKYIKNIKSDQKKIYFITADNYKTAKNSPHLEMFKKKDIDVLILHERIDEWMMNYLTEFKGIQFQSVNKFDESLNKIINSKDKKNKESNTKLKDLIKKIEKILFNKIKKVRITYRFSETPAALTTDSNEMSTQMAKLFSAAGQKVPKIKYIFEINPDHKLIKKISKIKNKKDIKTWIKMLFDQALLNEKGSLQEPNKFIKRVNSLLIKQTSKKNSL
ncbi:molecular chaperone HtpG [Buchnera aphidicola (Ceratoglyphina bambusae)]|uniref:molecular chaperone HtpG n=1 Tax=Buchnera aphidicola TaxID=9 RepID=UPI0031B88C13